MATEKNKGKKIPAKSLTDETEPKITYSDLKSEIEKNQLSKEELFSWFKEELDKKDEMIEKLRQENAVLFKTAIKAREELLTGHHKDKVTDDK